MNPHSSFFAHVKYITHDLMAHVALHPIIYRFYLIFVSYYQNSISVTVTMTMTVTVTVTVTVNATLSTWRFESYASLLTQKKRSHRYLPNKRSHRGLIAPTVGSWQ